VQPTRGCGVGAAGGGKDLNVGMVVADDPPPWKNNAAIGISSNGHQRM
jgi:hypothetical protein